MGVPSSLSLSLPLRVCVSLSLRTRLIETLSRFSRRRDTLYTATSSKRFSSYSFSIRSCTPAVVTGVVFCPLLSRSARCSSSSSSSLQGSVFRNSSTHADTRPGGNAHDRRISEEITFNHWVYRNQIAAALAARNCSPVSTPLVLRN